MAHHSAVVRAATSNTIEHLQSSTCSTGQPHWHHHGGTYVGIEWHAAAAGASCAHHARHCCLRTTGIKALFKCRSKVKVLGRYVKTSYGVFDTNKKNKLQNLLVNRQTNLLSLINLSLSHVLL